ncbi:MAG: carboxylesterase/lipase family protein [Gammaproteobacteria bacterium]|nr:carboxylesterase/lipase family protein [Gammaproteobacteria bacterium]
MRRRTVLAGMAAAGIAGAASRAFAATATSVPDPVVDTRHGRVRGQRGVAGGYKFFCVPYGASTEGEGRFMAPKPPAAWAGIREVPKQALIAPQIDPKAVPSAPGSRRAAVSGIGSEAGSIETEDCLNVTVYTPGIDSARRPVMVWLHGGGYFAGSGSNPMYEGSSLAVHGDVVVVNVNHRLNVLGYAHMPDSGEQFVSSGNVGILDLELALHWVKDNIERFGGDPKRVLIFGQSGGGGKVCSLWSMPSARGLFHRAAIQSGATRRLRSVEDGVGASERLLTILGLRPNQARELQRLPLAQLMAANFELAKKPALPGAPNNFAPVYDNRVVTRQPFDPVANPLNADIPLIVGCTSTENTAFMMGDAAAFRLDMAGLRSRMRALIGERAGDAAVDLYVQLKPLAAPSQLYFEMLSDRTRRQSILIAEMKAAQNEAKAWLYQLMWNTPVMDGLLRSPHSLDLPMIFDIAMGERWKPYTGAVPAADRVAKAMSRAWVEFARSGDPGTSELPWPDYSLRRRDVMLFDEESTYALDAFRETRLFWDDVANGSV